VNNDASDDKKESTIASTLENLEEASAIPPIPDVPTEDLVHDKTVPPKK